MHPGLYEQLLTESLQRLLAQLDPATLQAIAHPLDPEESHTILAQHLHHTADHLLATLPIKDRIKNQVQLCNELLCRLSSAIPDTIHDPITADPSRLLSLYPTDSPPPERPDTPLSLGCLLTGTRLDPSLLSQLRKEIRSAYHIDILCSFIKWTGIRILEDVLREFTARPGAKLRVITTSYLGATDLKAVEFLSQLPNTQLRISYDTHRTRLHAKAYLFQRITGFGSAYIGSSNLSHAALTDGLEWNVKVSQFEQPHLWEKLTATFETYWNDPEFTLYAPEQRERLRQALEAERFTPIEDGQPRAFFTLTPFPFQQEILDVLLAERTNRSRFRHLVVAATGTGKTMIAAFDYRRFCQKTSGTRPRLLFIAHREEILRQSLDSFRAVLRDHNFGDLLVGGTIPDHRNHLFCSIQSYNSRELQALPADHFHYVVVDEFHHAAAESYRTLLTHIRPQILLGLTATPERADGMNIRAHFDDHISAEIRLPDAINRKLLSPFQYFGISDSVDLSGLTWQRGGYRKPDLENLYTDNDIRASLIIDKMHEKLLSVRLARGLAFCVSIAHANYMAEKFRQAGIPAEALSSESDVQTRHTVQQRLLKREINFICTVDLYNEGIDIPEVDTVLFLRPTESLTVFLQQFGRGLRLSTGKDCLTVLDFIGHAHRSYRFDLRFKSLLSDPTRSLVRELKDGFTHLPAGCSIQLERIAKEHILNNINSNLRSGIESLVNALQTLADDIGHTPSFAEFFEHHQLEPDALYRHNVSWARLSLKAGLRPSFTDPDEERLTKGLHRISHIDSPAQIQSLLSVLSHDAVPQTLDLKTDRTLLMAHLSLWNDSIHSSGPADFLRTLQRNPVLRNELIDLLNFRLDRTIITPHQPQLPFQCPLDLHASYTRDEILAALGHWGWDNTQNLDFREGVLHLPKIHVDAFMFTLNKTETDYSPTTMYQDYAINDQLLHWQSQSTTSESSPTAQRYIHHLKENHTILLFGREHKKSHHLAAPYSFLGPAQYITHSGSRPVSFTWRLITPLPAKLLRRFARLAIA